MRVSSDGFVGIGDTTPTSALAVVRGLAAVPPSLGSPTGSAFFMGGASDAYGLIGGVAGAGYSWLQSQRVDATATAYDLVVQPSGGNLLVGMTDPGGIGTALRNDGTRITTNYATDYTVASFRFNGTQRGFITTTNSGTTYSTTSDYRLKEDVQPMVGASERLMNLKPVNFAWEFDGSRVDGFLAHEAQAVVPEAVTGEKDAVDVDGNPQYQGIDQSKLVPLLTAALQEALTEIASMKARIAALEAAQ
jgi:hypothetical protein